MQLGQIQSVSSKFSLKSFQTSVCQNQLSQIQNYPKHQYDPLNNQNRLSQIQNHPKYQYDPLNTYQHKLTIRQYTIYESYFNMKHVYTKADLMKLNQYYTLKSLTEQKLTPAKAVKEPPKPDQNELILKKTIQLFFQSTPIVDFDPAEQFLKIQRIPITQDKFCNLLTDVIFKKTKDKVDWAKNFLILKSKKPTTINQLQEKPQQQPKMQPLKINRYKFLVDILVNIKMSCSRLQQLLYKIIDMHQWNCQEKNNCKENYMEGYLAKLLFKKIIIPSGIFDPEQPSFKQLVFQNLQEKQLHSSQEKTQNLIEKKWAKESDIFSLKNQIVRWGPELLVQLVKEKTVLNSLDQKPSSQNKYFICKQCFCRQNNIEIDDPPKKKNKKKNKNKTNQLNTTVNINLEISQQKVSNDPSRKSSAIQIEDQTTTQDMDEQLQYETEKYYERVSNFLEDFKIDPDSRLEIRLKMTEDSEDENQLPQKRENKLMNRVRSILYKSNVNFK